MRFERKLVFQHRTRAQVELWIKLNPALFREAFPPRFVNNIYFDTPGFRHYLANKDGIAARTKVRIRWYGALIGRVDRPVLEFKHKHGLVGHKEAFPLHPFVLDDVLSRPEAISAVLPADLPPDARGRLAGVRPTLLNRYHRQYCVSADGRCRLTLDSGLEYHRPNAQNGNGPRSLETRDVVVVEIKYANEAASGVDSVTNGFPGRVMRMSKYATGIEALLGW
jgi:hypothetical protein